MEKRNSISHAGALADKNARRAIRGKCKIAQRARPSGKSTAGFTPIFALAEAQARCHVSRSLIVRRMMRIVLIQPFVMLLHWPRALRSFS
jgi:hypothetical protein